MSDSHAPAVQNKDEEIKLTKSVFENGRYVNPWSTWRTNGLGDFLRWTVFGKDNSSIPSDTKELDKTLPVRSVTDEDLKKFCEEDTSNKIKLMWVGHATSLINMENVIFITDPIFSERCAPSQMVGPKRYRPVPFTIDRLPRLDAVLISHNHYDHMDYESIKKLNDRFNGANGREKLHWFSGLGNAQWFRDNNINENVHELDWWQSKKVKNLKFVFTPAQHWCARGIFDRNKALWGSWTVIGTKKRFFFAGDTGYCSGFTEIGEKYGKIDLSAIPIGAYDPRWFMEPQHVDPAQAVKIHQDVKSNHSIGVHWGTFKLTNEHYLEPKTLLAEELKKANLDQDSFITIEHGQVHEV